MRRVLFLHVLCAVFPLYLFGQATSRLSGSVIDPSGLSVPGASVEIFLPGGSSPLLAANTTGEGLFAFTAVAPGTYAVVVTAKGFRKRTERGVVLHAGAETSLPSLKLEIGSVTDVVEVAE